MDTSQNVLSLFKEKIISVLCIFTYWDTEKAGFANSNERQQGEEAEMNFGPLQASLLSYSFTNWNAGI